MALFEKRKREIKPVNDEQKNNIELIQRPKICCIDLNDDVIQSLKQSGANIYVGTLGSKIRVPNKLKYDTTNLLLNSDFPDNTHEFDVFIIDLDNFNVKEYDSSEHKRDSIVGNNSAFLLSVHPENLFDPRPLSSSILKDQLNQINHQFIVIAFSTADYSINYSSITYNNSYRDEEQVIGTCSIYSFLEDFPLLKSKSGTETAVHKNTGGGLKKFLEKYIKGASYKQTFFHPNKWSSSTVLDENYLPLMQNASGEIIAYYQENENRNLFLFPKIENQSEFILEFLSRVGPAIFPSIFPFSSEFKWKEEKDYWLPEHSKLLDKKADLEADYKKRIEDCDKKIEENLLKYSFLHKIITSTGEELVENLIHYFKWLGFTKVNNVDHSNLDSRILEEDIQIELPDGILIIECKGINGTSTDSDCSQISKIKYRRAKERGRFDVKALYIVNHQRFLPPLSRSNPPFNDHQIQDAQNDERGLLCTWDLFNLYYDIENGLITKDQARSAILQFGLINFRPINWVRLGDAKELFQDGTIIIVNIKNVPVKINDELIIEKNGKYTKAKILGIQVLGKPVNEVINGEIGLKISSKILKNSTIWKSLD